MMLPVLRKTIDEGEEKNFFVKIYREADRRGLITREKIQEMESGFYQCLSEVLPKNKLAPQKSDFQEASKYLFVLLDYGLLSLSGGEIDQSIGIIMGMKFKDIYHQGGIEVEKILEDSRYFSKHDNFYYLDGDINKIIVHITIANLTKKDFCLEQYGEENSWFSIKEKLARAKAEIAFGQFLENDYPDLEEILKDERWGMFSVLGTIMINLGLYRRFSLEIEFQDVQVFQRLLYKDDKINPNTRSFILESFQNIIKVLSKDDFDQMVIVAKEHLNYLENYFFSIKTLELIHFYDRIYLYKAKKRRRKVSLKTPMPDEFEKIIKEYQKILSSFKRVRFLSRQKPTVIAVLTSEFGLTKEEYLKLFVKLDDRTLADYLTLLGVIYDDMTEKMSACHSEPRLDETELEKILDEFRQKDEEKYDKIAKKLSHVLEQTI